MIEIDKIYNEDCLEGMKRIDDGSVDCIITDLPYEVLNDGNPDAQWDKMLPFDKLWEQWLRVCKPNAAIVLFAQGMFTSDLMQSNRRMWRYNLIWDKSLKSGFLNANRMPLRQHEDIVVFYRELPTYNPQMVKCQPHQRNHTRGDMKSQLQNRCYGGFVATPTIISDEKFPTSIISIQKEHNVGKFYHPTQKPVNLLRYLIRTYTDTDNLVLDSCMGSGTTAIACLKEKRHFLGFELNKKYFDIAQQRIALERSQPTLDFGDG